MADNPSDGLWAFVVIGGFLILGLAIAFAKFRNRATAADRRRTEEGTADLYAQEEADRRKL